jgi:hypothetical protein
VADAIETRRERVAAQENASDWGRWAQDIASRLADLEIKTVAWLGADSKISDENSPAVIGIIEDWALDERRERAAAIAKLADAWTERLAAEIDVLSERLDQKLDSKIFDLGSLKAFKASMEKEAGALKAEVRAETQRTLAGMTGKLAAMEGQLRQRDQAKRALIVKLAEERAGKRELEARISALEERVKTLDRDLVEAGALGPETPPLPLLGSAG